MMFKSSWRELRIFIVLLLIILLQAGCGGSGSSNTADPIANIIADLVIDPEIQAIRDAFKPIYQPTNIYIVLF